MAASKFFDNGSEKDIEIEPEKEARPKSKCPDGGWGWMIVVASFVCNMIVQGICLTGGVYVKEILTHYGADPERKTLILSLLLGFCLLAGPVVGALSNRFGFRRVTIIGSVMTSIALLIGTNSPSIEIVIVILGIAGGIGLGLIYLPSIVIIGYWFERKRGFATGIAMCGSGVGILTFAPLNKHLLNEYDWKQSLVIVAGIILHCAICGALYRPLEMASKNRMKRGVVMRGSIMKALIAEKVRQRTISNGSLDNCIITKDNRLIKIDKIDRGTMSSSVFNRLKEQLGFSSRSLNKSKNSLIITTPIVKNNNMILKVLDSATNNSRPVTPKVEKKEIEEAPPVNKKRRKRDYERRRDSGCGSLESSPKSASYEVLPQQDPLEALMKDCEVTNLAVVTEVKRTLKPLPLRRWRLQRLACFWTLQRLNLTVQVLPQALIVLPQTESLTFLMADFRQELWVMVACYPSSIAPVFIRSGLSQIPGFQAGVLTSPISFYLIYIFLPERLSIECSEHNRCADVTKVEAIFGLSIFVGSIVVGWIGDRPWSNTLTFSNVAMILAGITAFICPVLSEEFHYFMFAMGFGFFTASYLTLRSIILVDLINLERLTSSFGLLCMFQGFAVVAGPSLAELLISQAGSHDAVFYLAGGVLVLAGVMGLPLRCPSTSSRGR
ncbi:hypothetical protein FSP39_023223 [Pinctada imbricata]|uniref:Major facilitator superfamily (MFS) profile domain-containing protein n=1 Tax=Pinctada imbricata TaxID=66713 RepID=A0AA89C3T2_PINIB|nr:hypothetical protein FSP39_023223 [Pinctada imbricata]